MEIMIAAQRAGNRAKAINKQARASTILLALETSLDFRQGGDIAITSPVWRTMTPRSKHFRKTSNALAPGFPGRESNSTAAIRP